MKIKFIQRHTVGAVLYDSGVVESFSDKLAEKLVAKGVAVRHEGSMPVVTPEVVAAEKVQEEAEVSIATIPVPVAGKGKKTGKRGLFRR